MDSVRASARTQVPSKLLSATVLLPDCSAAPGTRVPVLCSETHPEGQIGYRELARRNSKLGDIHSIDDRLDHDIDELMG
jgi:hypothetical protein